MANYNNLKARARKLNLMITRTTTAQDAYDFGGHMYVLHSAGQQWENMNDYSLRGIEQSIIEIETAQ